MEKKALFETERLRLYPLTAEDVSFIKALLNDPSFIENIGDRGVRTDEDALQYLMRGPIQNQQKNGFSMYRVDLKENGTSIGICGLVKREGLEDVDLGFAFLPQFWSKGYAMESSREVLKFARNQVGLKKIVAITSPTNPPSIRLLEKLGFHYENDVTLPRETKPIQFFTLSLENELN